MEEEESSGILNFVPLIVAVLGVFIGLFGAYYGYSATQRVQALEANVTEGSSGMSEMETALRAMESRLGELSSTVSTANSDVDAMRTRLRMLGTQMQEGLTAVTREVNTNREAITRTANNLNTLAEGMTTRAPTTPTRTASTGNSASAEAGSDTESTGNGRTYTIQAGDTLQAVARAQGVPLQALLDANPNADPRRLRIGQEIIIPE